MIRQKEGAASQQVARANQSPAISRKPKPSVADLEDVRESRIAFARYAGEVVVGFLALYILMFVAALGE